jgi:tRNA 2-selenouridine synthase
MRKVQLVNVSQLSDFDDIIDVRTPAEFSLDHIPNAINAPVLSNEERVRIGTLYKQASPFEAKREGAALIARNIAHHLETLFQDRPREWQPLVYCWRGGKRSGSMAHIFAQIGWRTAQLDGGYKSYRRHVIDELEALPSRYQFRVVCGATGSGKSRLLQALDEQGAQVLDLEKIARHRGSLLGNLPDQAQPSQKMFESEILETLRHFNTQQPIFVEAESRKIGNLAVPTTLLDQIRQSVCIAIEASIPARVQLLTEDYKHFLNDPALLKQSLTPLLPLHGQKVLNDWHSLAQQGDWMTLVEDLLSRHYDPAYQRSTDSNYPQLDRAQILEFEELNEASFSQAAQALIKS